MEKIGEVLVKFLVLSIVFEVALTPVFNWRIFLRYFDGKGLKTPITIILAFLMFWGYRLDIIRDILVALNYTDPGITFWGQVITAMLIAGGSDGVFRIFTKLGIRNPAEAEEKARVEQQALREKVAANVAAKAADLEAIKEVARIAAEKDKQG
jgi:hypothetical protein